MKMIDRVLFKIDYLSELLNHNEFVKMELSYDEVKELSWRERNKLKIRLIDSKFIIKIKSKNERINNSVLLYNNWTDSAG